MDTLYQHMMGILALLDADKPDKSRSHVNLLTHIVFCTLKHPIETSICLGGGGSFPLEQMAGSMVASSGRLQNLPDR